MHIERRGCLVATSIRLAPEVEQRLNELVERTHRTKAFCLREIIAHGLTDVEDYYRASETLERVRLGEERVYSSKEVRHDLGLDD